MPSFLQAADEWISLGPDGGVVQAIALDPSNPSTIYAATRLGGIFRSTNAGANWEMMSVGLDAFHVNSLAIDPGLPSTLYAATTDDFLGSIGGGGVFKSVDGGASWRAINEGLEAGFNKSVLSITIDPTQTSTLYAVGPFNVYRSVDGGGSWVEIAVGFNMTHPFVLVVDPRTSSTLYLGTQNAGVFKSADGGASWSAADTGLGSQTVSALAIDRTNPRRLYAGTTSGVFRTSDGGSTWSPANTGISTFAITTLALDPREPLTVYAGAPNGLFRSFDGGSSWGFLIALGRRSLTALALAPTDSLTIYAGAGAEGVLKSTDAGTSWSTASAGLRALSIKAVVIDPSQPSTILLSTLRQTAFDNPSLFRSTDAGRTWRDLSSGLPSESGFIPQVLALALDPADPSTVFAGSYNGAFKSLDRGVTWTTIDTGLPATPPPFPLPNSSVPAVLSLAVDPVSPQTVYAGISQGIHVGGGVFKSLDGGSSWNPSGLEFGAVDALAIDPQKTSTLFCTGYSLSTGSFAQKSSDGGVSWSGLSITNQSIRAFAIGANPAAVYAGGFYGIFKSVDEGETWLSASRGLVPTDPRFLYPDIRALAIDPGERPNIFAGSYGGGVFQSSTGGSNWISLNTGLPNFFVVVLTEDPSDSAVLYAGTDGNGLFRGTPNSPPPPREARVVPFR